VIWQLHGEISATNGQRPAPCARLIRKGDPGDLYVDLPTNEMKKRTNHSKPNANFGLEQNSARNWPEAKLEKFRKNLFQPVDALPLGIFRFLFGFLLCVEFFVISRVTFPEDYINPQFHFTYPLFDLLGLKPLSQDSLWLIFNVLRISTVGIMLGLLTRTCLIVFTSTFGYFFFMESTVYTHHYYLIFLLSFLMCFGHSGSVFSFDGLISKRSRRKEVDYWEIFLLRFQICVVFLFGAIAKMNADWLIHAAPLYLNLVRHFSLLGLPLHEKWVAVVLSWGGMLTDLGLAIALAIGRWPRLTFLWLCLFNGMNVLMFGLGIKTFPYLMVSSYILFLPSAVVRESVARFTNGDVVRKVLRLGRT
jgi:vitamin K-dependent gamma-carboxylase